MIGLYRSSVYRNQALFLIIFIFFLSCSSVGKRVVSESEVLTRTEIIQRSIEKVEENYNEINQHKNVGIYKRGYRDWKIILYSENNFYLVYMTEDGKVISIEKKEYIK